MVREDYMTSESFRSAEEKDNYYAELKTAAESGWDFSSRWFVHEGTNKGNYYSLITFHAMKMEVFLDERRWAQYYIRVYASIIKITDRWIKHIVAQVAEDDVPRKL